MVCADSSLTLRMTEDVILNGAEGGVKDLEQHSGPLLRFFCQILDHREKYVFLTLLSRTD